MANLVLVSYLFIGLGWNEHIVTMETQAFTILVALLGSGLLSAIVTSYMNRRTGESVEQLKARLESGLYVTKAHYDLELETFRKLWAALNNLRLKTRAFIAPDRFKISILGEEDSYSWYEKAFPNVTKDFFEAHDAAVRAVTEAAPFYPVRIKKAAELTFGIDLAIIARVSNLDGTEMSEAWFDELRNLSGAIDKQIQEVETRIRERLDDLRIIP